MMKLRTPVNTLNAAGAGGFNFGTICELWGEPKAGKSTFAYQCGEIFLQDYKDGELEILDAEKSANDIRLRRIFNINPGNKVGIDGKSVTIKGGDPRVTLAPAMTIEMGLDRVLKSMHRVSKTGKPLYVIWDSITTSMPGSDWTELQIALEKGTEAKKWSGGMMAKPRALADATNKMLAELWMSDNTIIALINQARMSIGQYHTSVDSPGGFAFKHNIHYSLKFMPGGPIGDSEYYKQGTCSKLTCHKSKFMPYIKDIPIFIYDTLGGKLSPAEELTTMASALGITEVGGGWYKFSDKVRTAENMDHKSYRFTQLLEDKAAQDIMYRHLVNHFRTNFKLVDWEYLDIEEKAAK